MQPSRSEMKKDLRLGCANHLQGQDWGVSSWTVPSDMKRKGLLVLEAETLPDPGLFLLIL